MKTKPSKADGIAVHCLFDEIVDIDTYGSPWRHYYALLPNIHKPTTIFLTNGLIKIMGGNVSKEEKEAIWINFKTVNPPQALIVKACKKSISYCFARCYDYNIIIIEAMEAVSYGNAKYYGLRLEVKK